MTYTFSIGHCAVVVRVLAASLNINNHYVQVVIFVPAISLLLL